MMHPRIERAARLLLLASSCLAPTACIDTPISLGRHEAPVPPPGDGDGDDDPNTMDASMVPPGGAGGASGIGGGLGGVGGTTGGVGGDRPEPPGPCDTGTLSAMLECRVDDPFGPPPRTMSTSATLTVVSVDPGMANVTGVLAFDAWGLSFNGRVEGELDCVRGTFHAVIADGMVMMQGAPGEFYGELDGLIDPSDGAISGPWWHGPEPQSSPRCMGPWAAERD